MVGPILSGDPMLTETVRMESSDLAGKHVTLDIKPFRDAEIRGLLCHYSDLLSHIIGETHRSHLCCWLVLPVEPHVDVSRVTSDGGVGGVLARFSLDAVFLELAWAQRLRLKRLLHPTGCCEFVWYVT